MKSKLLSLMLASTMVLSMAACGGGNTDSATSGGASDSQAADDSSTADDEVWECVVPWPSIGDSPVGLEDVEAAINEITVPEIGVQVTLNPIYCYDLNSQQTLMISSGDKLDLCLIMLETNSSYVRNGSIIDLNDLYEQYGSNIKNYLGDAVDACSVNGTIYSIPVGSTLGEQYGFLLRSDLLEKYGFDSSDRDVTYDEMTEILAAIKEGEGSGFYPLYSGGSIDCYVAYDVLGTSASSGVIMLDGDTDTVVNLYATDEYAEFAQLMYEWAQAGYISPDASASDAGTDLVKAGINGGQASSTNPGQGQWAANNAGYAMTALTTIPAYAETTALSNVSWGITPNCDNPEKAMQFIDLMYADNDLGTILSAGLEGQSYEIVDQDDEGNMIIQYPDGEDSSTIPYYNMFGVWPNNKTQMAPLTLDYFTELDEFNANIEYSPAFGFTFDSDEYASQIAAIDSVVAQYQEAIQGGKVDPAEQLPAFLQALEDAGINDVIAAKQAQYDEWRAAQE